MLKFEENFLPKGPKGVLLAASAKRLTDLGLYRFTLAEVAKAADVSRPHLNYHYSSMPSLMLDLAKSWGVSGQAVTDKHLEAFLGEPPKTIILEIVEATFEWKEKCPTFARMTPAIIHLSHHMPELSAFMDQVTTQGLLRIQLLLSKMGCQKKEVLSLSQSIHLLLIGGLLYQLERSLTSDKVISQQITKAIELLLEN